MAAYENARTISAQCAVTASVAAVIVHRFVAWAGGSTPEQRQVATLVPGANGAVPAGVCAMKPDAVGVKDGFATIPIQCPDGGIGLIELGEAVTTMGAPLRVGGNSSEVDGAAYLANATGDVIVGYATELGGVGAVIAFQFTGFSGTAA